MNRVTRKILQMLLLALVLPGVSGCSSHSDEPALWQGELYLQLSVSVLDADRELSRSASRANEIYYELPDLDTEKLQTLRIIIARADNDVIVYNDYQELSTPRLEVAGMRYLVDFSTKYNIYLVGNEISLPEDSREMIQNLEEGTGIQTHLLDEIVLTADAPGGYILNNEVADNKRAVPMSEKFEVTTYARPQTGQEFSINTIEKDLFVTRSVSKFSFNFYKSEDYAEDNTLEIKAVRIYGLGEKEFFIPKDTKYSPDKDLPSDNQYNGRLITEFAVPLNNASGDYTFDGFSPVKVSSLTTPDDPSTVTKVCFSPEIYFPETRGRSRDDGFMCSISFDGESYLKPVELPNLLALPRNTHVVVNITINSRREIKCEVDLVPYRGCVLDPWFGLPDPEDTEDPKPSNP